MPATRVQANWCPVSYAGNPLKKITAVNINQGGTLMEHAADCDHYPTVLTNLMSKPTASVTSADIGSLMAIAPGTVGAFSATHKDAMGQVGGDIVYTLINAVAENTDANGPFGQPGTATFRMRAFSSDGQTNPLSFSRA
jgi:hypothetical protein